MGKKIGIVVLVLLGLFILLVVFAPAPEDGSPSSSPTNTMETYTNTSEGFSLSYPSEWYKVENPVAGSLVMFQAPSQGDDDAFGENLNVLVQDVSASGMTLEEYHDLSVEQVQTNMGNAVIKADDTAGVGGLDGYRLVYTGIYPNQQTETAFLQYFVMNEGKVYLFTYAAEPSEYETYLADIEAMIASIRFE